MPSMVCVAIGGRVVKCAADDPFLADRQLQEQGRIRAGRLAVRRQGEHAQRHPIGFVGRNLGSAGHNRFRLLGVLLGRGHGLIAVVDRIVGVVHVFAVSVGDGFTPAVADPAGQRCPGGPTIRTIDPPGSPVGIIRPEIEPGVILPDLIAYFVAPLAAILLATAGDFRSGRDGSVP